MVSIHIAGTWGSNWRIRSANLTYEVPRVATREQVDVHEAELCVLVIREKCLGRRRLPQIAVFGVGDHADHLNVRLITVGIVRFMVVQHPEEPPDGIAAGKIARGEALIDDGDHDGAAVLVGKGASLQDGNAEGGEIARADHIENRLVGDRRSFEILAEDRVLPGIALEKRHGGKAHRCDSGHGAKIDRHPFEEGFGLLGGIAAERRVNGEGEEVFGWKSWPLVLQIAQGTNEKACAHQQEQGQRHLDDNEETMQRDTAGRSGCPSFQERGCNLGARTTQGGHESKRERGKKEHSERKNKHSPIGYSGDGKIAGPAGGQIHPEQKGICEEGEAQPYQRAGAGEQQSFHHELTNDAAASRSDSEADRDFALPSGGAGQHEIGKIGAGQQKDRCR